MKVPQDFSTSKDKFKQFGGTIFTGFELDLKITLTHVLGENDIDHVSKKFPHNGKGWVENATTHLLDVFHISDVNIDFALV
jgi:hypothetical protein